MTQTTSHPSALITGGTTGIGHATARLLHEQGFSVLVTGVNADTIAEAERTLPQAVVVFRADARSLSDANRVAEELKGRFGRLDFAFFNAGIGRMLPFDATDETAFDDHFAVNVKGQYFTLQHVLPLIPQNGSVVFNSAIGAQRGVPNWSAYSATKGALEGLIPQLAVELAPRGIRVNGIRPGPVDTPAFDKLGLPDQVVSAHRESVPKRIPLGRMGTPEEVAEIVAFLASPASRYITGTIIPIDGGLSSAAK